MNWKMDTENSSNRNGWSCEDTGKATLMKLNVMTVGVETEETSDIQNLITLMK